MPPLSAPLSANYPNFVDIDNFADINIYQAANSIHALRAARLDLHHFERGAAARRTG